MTSYSTLDTVPKKQSPGRFLLDRLIIILIRANRSFYFFQHLFPGRFCRQFEGVRSVAIVAISLSFYSTYNYKIVVPFLLGNVLKITHLNYQIPSNFKHSLKIILTLHLKICLCRINRKSLFHPDQQPMTGHRLSPGHPLLAISP